MNPRNVAESADESEDDESALTSEDHMSVVEEVVRDGGETVQPLKKQRMTADEHSADTNILEDEVLELPAAQEETETIEPKLPPATLHSFPLPALPNAPSKSTLALQGLDQALVDAEFVDPTILLPIPDGDDHQGTMLSQRTRKKLKDLGITELFAGKDSKFAYVIWLSPTNSPIVVQTRLLPFLLPQDPFQKALYQPYQPPRDVCVSAPTGSGKTLAYVLPIIEVGRSLPPSCNSFTFQTDFVIKNSNATTRLDSSAHSRSSYTGQRDV